MDGIIRPMFVTAIQTDRYTYIRTYRQIDKWMDEIIRPVFVSSLDRQTDSQTDGYIVSEKDGIIRLMFSQQARQTDRQTDRYIVRWNHKGNRLSLQSRQTNRRTDR